MILKENEVRISLVNFGLFHQQFCNLHGFLRKAITLRIMRTGSYVGKHPFVCKGFEFSAFVLRAFI